MLISLTHPYFQQICLGMQQAHTAFYQSSASTALRLSKIFLGWFTFQKILISNTLSTIKDEFWGKKTWGPWSIWMKNDLKEQKLNWSNLKKSFMGWLISSKLSGQLRILLKNNHSKFECCTTPLWMPCPLSSYSTNNYE